MSHNPRPGRNQPRQQNLAFWVTLGVGVGVAAVVSAVRRRSAETAAASSPSEGQEEEEKEEEQKGTSASLEQSAGDRRASGEGVIPQTVGTDTEDRPSRSHTLPRAETSPAPLTERFASGVFLESSSSSGSSPRPSEGSGGSTPVSETSPSPASSTTATGGGGGSGWGNLLQSWFGGSNSSRSSRDDSSDPQLSRSSTDTNGSEFISRSLSESSGGASSSTTTSSSSSSRGTGFRRIPAEEQHPAVYARLEWFGCVPADVYDPLIHHPASLKPGRHPQQHHRSADESDSDPNHHQRSFLEESFMLV